ncbi:type II toxin-antitoxin system HicB family antitoxin [Vagococcus salmoninarum]|uniref:type II toxin-antitoxin system HicB family antitoxin n=1 Tax=Vagococcus salmoninarum TaxID=2739 RepID=UPI00187F57F9|nr:type II toxin-antitoxin system HicB family antitoxin [Vagococcus salmoninarum]MBE9390027.1 type II toxin-antitoxin system HicB family antitoxin [Vagococcus salmoninarum]
MLVYPATFETDGDYTLVKFPDIPEAITQGETINQAYEMASEVLGLALEGKTTFPQASSIEAIQKANPNASVALIGIDLSAYRRKYHSKTIRKNVTVPEWLSDMASAENINFSQTLTDALKEKLGV